LYSALSAFLQVIFIGVVDPVLKGKIPSAIKILPSVPNEKLPEYLKMADIMTIFYKDTPYIKAVLPAKFFECLAAKKPVLVSGLQEAKPYYHVVYDVYGSVNNALEIIKNLPRTETSSLVALRNKIAMEASWENRFQAFVKDLNICA
jgi:teichuronic acid biosynthesis glycosyltransferase TuaH